MAMAKAVQASAAAARRRRVVPARLAILAAASVVAWRGPAALAAAPAAAPAAAAAPARATASAALYALSLPDAEGQPQALAQWKGKLLVVNFWATWCVPCVAEMPELDRLQREFGDSKVQIVAIGVEDGPKVRAFRDRLGLHLTLLAGGYDALELAHRLGDPQRALPYTALFSSDGELLHARVGALAKDELRGWLAAAHAAEPR
jgi:thiol-disulfide isomerase/thioredoxin